MQKNRKKIGMIARFWLCTILLLSSIPVASADDTMTCNYLNQPEKTKDWVISIIEEQLGEHTSMNEEIVSLKCFRVTIQTPQAKDEKDKKANMVSCYKPSCSIGGSDSCIVNKETQSGPVISCQQVQVFYSKSGIDLLFSYIGLIYKWAAGMIGIVSVFYLIYGGIKITTAGDNQSAVDEAKTKIAQSIGGLVLLFLSAIILYTINPNFFVL